MFIQQPENCGVGYLAAAWVVVDSFLPKCWICLTHLLEIQKNQQIVSTHLSHFMLSSHFYSKIYWKALAFSQCSINRIVDKTYHESVRMDFSSFHCLKPLKNNYISLDKQIYPTKRLITKFRKSLLPTAPVTASYMTLCPSLLSWNFIQISFGRHTSGRF